LHVLQDTINHSIVTLHETTSKQNNGHAVVMTSSSATLSRRGTPMHSSA